VIASIRARLFLSLGIATLGVLVATWIFAELSTEPSSRGQIRSVLAFASVLALIVGVALTEWVARRFAGPLEELRRTADALAAGDFEVRARSRRPDEIGGLGRAIDRMADQLAERLAAVRNEETRLRVMLDAMEEAVIVADRDGRIALSNAAFVRMSGSTGLGRTIAEAMRSGELHDAVREAIAGRSAKAMFDLEGGRQKRTVAAHVAPLPAQAGLIVVLHDVTELRRLDAVRRDFVANASHELRTPLTAIRGFAETLRDGALEEPRIAKRFVGNIVENAMRLQRLVDDLLELSRSESPEAPMVMTSVDPLPIVSKVLTALEGRASSKGVQLGVEGTPESAPIRADARALDQVLMNLVDNAIKYTPSGGRVIVRLARDADALTIEVADNGPGISASHLPRIFERFYRVDAGRSREQGGTGLGLAIVKHLTQGMHGEVSVESKVGRGTTFRVRLARADGAPAQSAEQPSSA
jgi:two-component system phosphate regulon sensor histidine kinase PhoR